MHILTANHTNPRRQKQDIIASGSMKIKDLSASDPCSIANNRGGASISIRNVSHAFTSAQAQKGELALDRVSLEIKSGEFVAFVGPSGCGKTTLLNMIAGLITPSLGEVIIDGDIIERPTKHTGYMFARDGLLPWRTAVKNVATGLEVRGLARSECEARAQGMLEMVGLGAFKNHFPRQLSQGMRQRVAIARTLATNPDTLLMDEPFAALDAQTKIRLESEFLGIWDGSGKTVVFVTHDLSEAILLADRVVVFAPSPGRVIADIPIELPRPRDLQSLRFKREYLEVHEQLWHILKGDLHE